MFLDLQFRWKIMGWRTRLWLLRKYVQGLNLEEQVLFSCIITKLKYLLELIEDTPIVSPIRH